jgi:transposase
MLQNMDTENFTHIMRLSWKQAWNIIERSVTRGRERKKDHPRIMGIDEKSYKKVHKYITLVYDMINKGVEYIAYDRKK